MRLQVRLESSVLAKAAGSVAQSDTCRPTQSRTADAKVEETHEVLVDAEASEKGQLTADLSANIDPQKKGGVRDSSRISHASSRLPDVI